ncbi:hypothetical protein [Portibacter lacus]|uniref:Transposase IS200-like domain-containing protein n=1 Tax=Portibacter lacus TaxID=1099794 RepID=A0AA37SNI1_9BACT|nr:hypothetical protein [Portibacter lacus]GLR15828.1 hypothetical protein GCM10007940_04430 [Portibacter lacus]
MSFNYWQKFDHDNVYHIYNRSIQEALLFQDNSDYTYFLKKYKEYLSPYFATYAYCLIPNHFHFLVKIKPLDACTIFIKEEKTLTSSKFLNNEIGIDEFLVNQIRRFFSSIVLSHNKKYGRKGNLFAKRFKRVTVSKEAKLSYLVCYLHHNPIHHGLTKSMIDWKHSSFRAYNSNQKTLLEKELILKWFGGLKEFLEAHLSFQSDFKDNKRILERLEME